MDKEMLDRAAKAAALADGYDSWDTAHIRTIDKYSAIVMAVIKAMREPTEKMLEAGLTAEADCFQEPDKSVVLEIHQAMIDAITGDK